MEQQRGSLLIEVLVSMALGVFLMYGALQVLVTTKQNALFRSAASEVAQNGRLALELLATDIRSAGYRGCAPNGKTIAVGASFSATSYYGGASLDPNVGIRGWDYANDLVTPVSEWIQTRSFNDSGYWAGASAVESYGTGKYSGADFTLVRGSDTLRLWSVEPYVMSTSGMSTSTVTPVSGTMDGFPSGGDDKLLIVSDCERSVLVKASNFTDSSISLSGMVPEVISPFTGSWPGQAVMLNMVQYTLEIPTGRTRPSLYRREMGADGNFGNKVEVMPGILNMQFQYGFHPYGDSETIQYRNATQMSDWNDVFSVKIWMLVETEGDYVLPDSQTVNYYENSYNFGDRRLRREFTTVVTLRNRVLGE